MQDLVVTSILACQHGGFTVLCRTGWVLEGGCLPDFGHGSTLQQHRGVLTIMLTPAAALMYRSSEQGSTLFERLVAALEEHAEGRIIYLTGVHAA